MSDGKFEPMKPDIPEDSSPDKEEMRSTYKSRMLRFNRMKAEVERNGKMKEEDLIKFCMNRWMLSRLVIERYIDELINAGFFKRSSIKSPPPSFSEVNYIEYV